MGLYAAKLKTFQEQYKSDCFDFPERVTEIILETPILSPKRKVPDTDTHSHEFFSPKKRRMKSTLHLITYNGATLLQQGWIRTCALLKVSPKRMLNEAKNVIAKSSIEQFQLQDPTTITTDMLDNILNFVNAENTISDVDQFIEVISDLFELQKLIPADKLRMGVGLFAEELCFQAFYFLEQEEIFVGCQAYEDICMLLSDIYFDLATADVSREYLTIGDAENLITQSMLLIDPNVWSQKHRDGATGYALSHTDRLEHMESAFHEIYPENSRSRQRIQTNRR